jgi:uncharacterized protein YndB with AHSA1/START domain
MIAAGESEAAPMNQTSLQLEGDREIIIRRTFNGPARLVFDAWSNPELVKRWWAPESLGVSIVSCEADVRVGGGYRYVLRHRTGNDFAFSGRYTEVAPPSRLVYTQIFEPTAGGARPGDASILVTVTFDEVDGRTQVVSHTMCPSPEVRDGIIASGMEQGMRETMDQLETLVMALGDGSSARA